VSASWRECPFVEGRQYAVTHDFQAYGDRFRAGERLTFVRDAFSVYHGMTGYFFLDESGGDRRLDVSDDEQGDTWHAALVPVDTGGTSRDPSS
jgi:hypothetical protein